MGLRFSRRIRLLPGIRLNLSKSGASVSVGRRGAWLTVGPKGSARTTVGIPGTGLSYTTTHPAQPTSPPGKVSKSDSTGIRWFWIVLAIVGIAVVIATALRT